MISEFGNLTVVLSILTSFFLIIFSIIELKKHTKKIIKNIGPI